MAAWKITGVSEMPAKRGTKRPAQPDFTTAAVLACGTPDGTYVLTGTADACTGAAKKVSVTSDVAARLEKCASPGAPVLPLVDGGICVPVPLSDLARVVINRLPGSLVGTRFNENGPVDGAVMAPHVQERIRLLFSTFNHAV